MVVTHEKFEGERVLTRIHVGESDKWHGKSLPQAIVEMLREMVEGGLISVEKVRVILYRPAKR